MNASLPVAAALLAGCAPLLGPGAPGELPRQQEALDYVWHDLLGDDAAPPQVWVVEGADLDCTTSSGLTGYEAFGECRLGFTPGLALGHVISLAVHPGDRIWDLPLVHECMHAHQARSWVFDPGHKRPEWASVDALHARLVERMEGGAL